MSQIHHSHMDYYQIEDFEHTPVKGTKSLNLDIERRRTDVVCIIINTLFVLLLFVLSLAILDAGTFRPTQTN